MTNAGDDAFLFLSPGNSFAIRSFKAVRALLVLPLCCNRGGREDALSGVLTAGVIMCREAEVMVDVEAEADVGKGNVCNAGEDSEVEGDEEPSLDFLRDDRGGMGSVVDEEERCECEDERECWRR